MKGFQEQHKMSDHAQLASPGKMSKPVMSKPGGKSHGKVFISYRRDQSATTTGRIHDWLVQRLPRKDVFFDIDSIEYGADFERRIQAEIPRCKAVLAIIGPHWLTAEGGPSS
jgi:hypothetical protein